MKKLLLPLLFSILVSTFATAQFSVSYNVGKSFNKVSVGYNVNQKIVPYIGFQYLGTSFSATDNGEEFGEFSASAFMPNLGLKYYFVSKEKLKAGLNIGFYKPFFSLKSSDDDVNDEIRDVIDGLSIFMGELGFISEYYIDPSFSIGGEFGLRFASSKFENNFDGDKLIAKNNLNFTFSSFSLNYHF